MQTKPHFALHVDGYLIGKNRHEGTNDPVAIVRHSLHPLQPFHYRRVEMTGPCELIHLPDAPLDGEKTVAWVITASPIIVHQDGERPRRLVP